MPEPNDDLYSSDFIDSLMQATGKLHAKEILKNQATAPEKTAGSSAGEIRDMSVDDIDDIIDTHAPVTSVNGSTGDVDLDADDIDDSATDHKFINQSGLYKLGSIESGAQVNPSAATLADAQSPTGTESKTWSAEYLSVLANAAVTGSGFSGGGGSGDMLQSIYDPSGVQGDTFDLGNMRETDAYKLYSGVERAKLAGIEAGAQTNYPQASQDEQLTPTGNYLRSFSPSGIAVIASGSAPVQSVAGKTGVVTLDKSDVGLDNVDNTSDTNKPISSATQAALNLKVNSGDMNSIDKLNVIITGGGVLDSTGSARTPLSHANTHISGSDIIQLATPSQNGLMSSLYAGKIDSIESGAQTNPANASAQDALNPTGTEFKLWNASLLATLAAVAVTGSGFAGGGSGDMLQIVYDPSGIEDDVFNVDNHYNGSTNRVFTAAEQSKLINIEAGAQVNYPVASQAEQFEGTGISSRSFSPSGVRYMVTGHSPVRSVAGKTGVVTLSKSDVGLSNVDNTSDVNKPISNATQAALDLKISSGDMNDVYKLNLIITGDNVLDSTGNARTPLPHSTTHVSGADQIQDATESQKGLMLPAFVQKLNSIESGASAGGNASFVYTLNAYQTLSSGDVCYINQAGELSHASASGVNTSAGLIVIGLENVSSGTACDFITFGPTYYAGVLKGHEYFLDLEASTIATGIPTGIGETIRSVGYGIEDDYLFLTQDLTVTEIGSGVNYISSGDINDIYKLNTFITGNGVLDSTGDARTPLPHAVSHISGSDNIQLATASQNGLMSSLLVGKLNSVASGAQANPTDSEIVTAFGNEVPQISTQEKINGTGLAIRQFAPADIPYMVTGHESVTSVAGKQGVVTLDKTDVGLSNVDNTADANKPISTATQNALNLKISSGDMNDVYKLNQIITGNAVLDSTGDSRTPLAHATTHVSGSDNIQLATASQNGLMSSSYAEKLDAVSTGIEIRNILGFALSAEDEGMVTGRVAKTYVSLPFVCTEIYMSLNDAPTSGNIGFNVQRNDSDILWDDGSIPAGTEFSGFYNFTGGYGPYSGELFSKHDKFTVIINQVGSGTYSGNGGKIYANGYYV